jgi:hypothetical protein
LDLTTGEHQGRRTPAVPRRRSYGTAEVLIAGGFTKVLFLGWTAKAATAQTEDGVETILVHDGEIVVQTVHYTVQPA